MPQVLFVKRQGAYWPGANPTLADDVAASYLKSGVAVPFTEATRKKIAQMVAQEATGGINAEAVDLSKFKARDEQEESGPFDELELDARAVHLLTKAGLKDIDSLEEYATTHDDFTKVEGIGPAFDEQIRASLNKRVKK